MFKKIYDIFAFACREATLLMEEKSERKLSGYENIKLKFHLAICSGCRQYNKQTAMLNTLLKKAAEKEITDFSKLTLAPDAKARMQAALNDKLNKQ